jgi:hypothetical protein
VTAAILQAACVILILCSQSSLTPKLLLEAPAAGGDGFPSSLTIKTEEALTIFQKSTNNQQKELMVTTQKQQKIHTELLFVVKFHSSSSSCCCCSSSFNTQNCSRSFS